MDQYLADQRCSNAFYISPRSPLSLSISFFILSQCQHFNLVQNGLLRLDLLQLVFLQGLALFLLSLQLLDGGQLVI